MEVPVIPVIPYRLHKFGYIPTFHSKFIDKFVYNIYSSINGCEVKKLDNKICTHLEIVLPEGIECDLKSNYHILNNKIVKNENFTEYLTRLPNLIKLTMSFEILPASYLLEIQKGTIIGHLLFNTKVMFLPFVEKGMLKNNEL